MIATYKLLPKNSKGGRRTNPKHLPYPIYEGQSVEKVLENAKRIGPKTHEVALLLFRNYKVQEQAILEVNSMLHLTAIYSGEKLETACRNAVSKFSVPGYKEVSDCLNKLSKKNISEGKNEKASGLVRGSEYYKKAGI